MKVIHRSVPLWALLLALVACGSVAIAAVMLYREVIVTMKIEGRWDMEILDTDKTTILTSLDLGTLYRDDIKRYPEIGTKNYWIRNIGDYAFYVSQSNTGVPSDVTFKVYYRPSAMDDWEILTADTEIYPTPLAVGAYGEWYLEVTVSPTATFAAYSITLTWNAHETATG